MSKKITVNANSLRTAIRRAMIFVPPKPILPVCEMLHFVIDPSGCYVEAFDGESIIQSRFVLAENTSHALDFQVRAKAVATIVSTLGTTEAEIDIVVGTKNVTFGVGNNKHRLPMPEDGAFIQRPQTSTTLTIALTGAMLHHCEKTVNKLVSQNEQDQMSGLGKGLTMQYSDEDSSIYFWGGSVARTGGMRVKYLNALPQGFGMVITDKLITKSSVLYDRDDSVLLNVSEKHLEICTDNIRITSTRPDVTTPNFMKVFKWIKTMPQDFIVEIPLFELQNTCERLSVHADEAMKVLTVKSFGDSRNLEFILDNQATASYGTEQVYISNAEKINDTEICVNIKFMQEIIHQCSANNIKMQVCKGGMLISNTTEDHDFFYIISPVRA